MSKKKSGKGKHSSETGARAGTVVEVGKESKVVKLTINMDDTVRRDFKMWCIEHDMTMSDFINRAVENRDRVLEMVKDES